MALVLAFNSSRAAAFKVAEFSSITDKQRYVEAEFSNIACKDAWFRFQAAKTVADRRVAGTELDVVRWQFYKQWRQKYKPEAEANTSDGAA